MKKLTAIVLWLTAFTACKKSNDSVNTIDYNATYETTASLQLDAPVLYSVSGTVTNQDSIKNFLTQKNLLTGNVPIIPGTNTTSYSGYTVQVSFAGPDTASITIINSGFITTHKAVVTHTGDEDIVLTNTDSSVTYSTPLNGVYLYDSLAIVSWTGGLSGGGIVTYKYVEQYPLKVINGNLYMPLISSVFYYSNANGTVVMMSTTANNWKLMDTSVVKDLKAGEVLVTQSGKVPMKKS